MSEWLNTTFFGIDNGAFNLANGLAKAAGDFFNPFFRFISFFGDKGLVLIILSVLLLLFKRTRKIGLSMLIAIGVGSLITNLGLKKIVQRPRPFKESLTYLNYWMMAGGEEIGSFSFPSGHTTIAMTTMTALFLCTNKKKSWVVFIFVALMGMSRIYLIVHYLTDVIAGIIVGAIGGVCGYYLGKFIFSIFEKYKDNAFCKFVLNSDLLNFSKRLINK